MADAYKSFNRPSGKPGKSAGGGRFLGEKKKTQSFANEAGTPGQNAPGMASMGGRMYTGESAAVQTYTQRKAK